ncbi:hypothetical protein ACF1A3_35720, partial [Streptomyces globisporus]|uniref:hypothetical protein n=1 Tax=Streptomyces globisporus TaxID=1908 RepID=UPI0036F769DE
MDKFALFFDADYYKDMNPDLPLSGADLWQHFQSEGFREGRNYLNFSNPSVADSVINLKPQDPSNPLHVRFAAAEVYLQTGNPSLSLSIVRDTDEFAGNRAISIELRSLIALSKLEEATSKAIHYFEEKLLSMNWYSDHLLIIKRLIETLAYKLRYKKAWELCQCFEEHIDDKITLRELEFLSKCKSTNHYIGADSSLSSSIAYQAEARQEVDLAIAGYSRAIVLGHSDKNAIAIHIDDLVVYKTRDFLGKNLVEEAIDYLIFRLSGDHIQSASGYQVANVVLEVAEAAVFNDNNNFAEQMIKLSRELNNSLPTEVVRELVVLIMNSQENKSERSLPGRQFYNIASRYTLNTISSQEENVRAVV